MNNLEELEEMAAQNNVDIVSYRFDSDRIKGLYCDNTIALSDSIGSTAEKACVLAEELGHHCTTSGDILDQQDTANVKQERHARIWAYDRMVGLFGIAQAYDAGCSNIYEMAEYLDVTEEFLSDAIAAYKAKYGTTWVQIDGHMIVFEPDMMIMRIN